MSSSIAIGFSQAVDPQEAAYQAALSVKKQFGAEPVDTILLFTSVHYAKKEVLETIHTILSPAKLVGSSSAGLILSDAIVSRGIIIVAITSSDIGIGAGSTSYSSGEEFRQFGFELTRKILLDYKSSLKRQAAFIFFDGLLPYDNQFLLGAQENLGHTYPMTGAFSCDDFRFKQSYQFHQKQIFSRGASGFLIGSNSPVVFSSQHGFMPLGKPRTITSAQGRMILTIDHKPAVHIYEEFFQDGIANLKKGFLNSPGVLYPLGIYLERQRQYLIRCPVDILTDGSIVCQADVPPNTEVHLMINNKDSCTKAASLAATQINDALEGRQPQLVIAFTSLIRHKILGRHLFSEIQAIKEVLGQSTPIAGMYSFGELCHFGENADNSETYLQNASLLLMAIG